MSPEVNASGDVFDESLQQNMSQANESGKFFFVQGSNVLLGLKFGILRFGQTRALPKGLDCKDYRGVEKNHSRLKRDLPMVVVFDHL